MEVAGRVEAETDSGGIRISPTQAASIHARADSGGADIALAPTGGYEIMARSRNGRVTADKMTFTRSASQRDRRCGRRPPWQSYLRSKPRTLPTMV